MKRASLHRKDSLSKTPSMSLLDIHVPGIPFEKWQDLLVKQERDIIILEIREEIISKVMEKCQDIYLEQKSVELLVNCAHQAWRRLVGLYFYDHDKEFDDTINTNSWLPDEACFPIPADSMAAQRIEMKIRSMTEKSSSLTESCMDSTKFLTAEEFISSGKGEEPEEEEERQGVTSFDEHPPSDQLSHSVRIFQNEYEDFFPQISEEKIPCITDEIEATSRRRKSSKTVRGTSIETMVEFSKIANMEKKSLPFVCLRRQSDTFRHMWYKFQSEMVTKCDSPRNRYPSENYTMKRISVYRPLRSYVDPDHSFPTLDDYDRELMYGDRDTKVLFNFLTKVEMEAEDPMEPGPSTITIKKKKKGGFKDYE